MVAPVTPNNTLKKEQSEVNIDDTNKKLPDERPVCGIIMPISAMGDYEVAHWARVRIVLEKSIEQAGYRPRLVSESEAVSVIQAQIVQNIYEDDIVVCDVSAKNPNVMFELGLRLAFDKPVVVVKDDKTDYSFDTSPIKHIPYRHDLRFDDVESFRSEVAAAITATMEVAKQNADFSPFLRYFGKYTPRKISTTEVDSSVYLIERMNKIEDRLIRNNDYIRMHIQDAKRAEIRKSRIGEGHNLVSREAEFNNIVDHIMNDEKLSDIEKDDMIEEYRKSYGISALSKFYK